MTSMLFTQSYLHCNLDVVQLLSICKVCKQSGRYKKDLWNCCVTFLHFDYLTVWLFMFVGEVRVLSASDFQESSCRMCVKHVQPLMQRSGFKCGMNTHIKSRGPNFYFLR